MKEKYAASRGFENLCSRFRIYQLNHLLKKQVKHEACFAFTRRVCMLAVILGGWSFWHFRIPSASSAVF